MSRTLAPLLCAVLLPQMANAQFAPSRTEQPRESDRIQPVPVSDYEFAVLELYNERLRVQSVRTVFEERTYTVPFEVTETVEINGRVVTRTRTVEEERVRTVAVPVPVSYEPQQFDAYVIDESGRVGPLEFMPRQTTPALIAGSMNAGTPSLRKLLRSGTIILIRKELPPREAPPAPPAP